MARSNLQRHAGDSAVTHVTCPPGRAATVAVSTTIVSVLPLFLVGGLAVQICRDLHLNPAQLGIAVSVHFGASALASVPCGKLVERHGPARTGPAAIALATASMLAIALLADSLATLTAFLVLAAVANALGQLAANLVLVRHVPARRQGLSFGVKQAAIPLSTLLAGATVPTVALTVGWRWGFVLAAVVGAAALWLTPPNPDARRPDPARPRRGQTHSGLLVVAVSTGLASGAVSALSPFLVASAVAGGAAEGPAGWLLAFGSAIGVSARIGGGWLADMRQRGHIAVIAAMLGLGAGGFALLSLPGAAPLLIGTAVAFGLGWSWPGLLNFAVARLHPHAPAAATSVSQTGVYVGACLGPLGFGVLVTAYSYAAGWRAAAAMMLLSSVLMIVAARMSFARA